ncbi:hypothetical protein PILCRDRAFT_89709 [Piloderma croceum F 1598]|uniref:Uncharacterized protein n=1 Tax=Piloderma croceum (strain F 1598) TaxID=765440 RepID=A0A0C3F727_PILCF|nr:hypothetical protein PILCRDRAFT_89709 [Piloderma croceum F 1598]
MRIHEGSEAASSPHNILRLQWRTQYYDPIPAAPNDPALWLPRGHTSWQRRPQTSISFGGEEKQDTFVISERRGRPSSKSAYTSNEVDLLVGLVEALQITVEPMIFDLDVRCVIVEGNNEGYMTVSGHMPQIFSLRPTMSPDFIINKRRKRTHAVDPCLGFYPISHSSTTPQTFTKQSSISTVHDVPPIATLSPALFFNAVPDSAHSLSEVEDTSSNENHEVVEVVTVDEFLRRSAEKKPTKNYGRRKRRVVDLTSDSELEEPSSSSAPRPNPPNRKNIKRIQPSRKKAKLAGRLVRAAVLAHVDPIESLRRRRDSNIGEFTRQPLQFVNETHSPVKITSRGRTATLVDPRKIAPFHEPYSFAHRSQSPVMNTRKQKPVTKWKSACHWTSPSSNSRTIRTKDSVVHDKTSTLFERPPKSLRTPLLFPASQIQEDRIPDRSSKRIKHSSPAFSPLVNHPPSKITPRPLITSLVGTRISPSQHDSLSSLPVPATHKISSAPWHSSSPDLSTAPHIQPPDPSGALEARPGPKKPLKALASFLGSFLETARNATQMQAKPSRSSVKRKRTKGVGPSDGDSNVPHLTHEDAAEEPSRKLSTPRLQPLRSMRSFIETSVQTPSSSVAMDAHQPPLLARPVLLRTLTARSHLLFKSVKSQTIATSVSSSVANMHPHSSSDFRVAAYVNHSPVAKVTESLPVSLNVPLNSSLQPVVSGSYALPSGSPSPQQILAALQPPKALIVLSSTPTLSTSADAHLSVNSC